MRWSRIAGLALGISGCNAIAGINAGTPRAEGEGGSSTTGTGGTTMCKPGLVQPCYSGPDATKGKGACKSGEQTCNADGLGFGDCLGEILPVAMDDCATKVDATCDEILSCPCTPKSMAECTTPLSGLCSSGTRVCLDTGEGYDVCVPLMKPAFDDCFSPADEDCDSTPIACVGGSVVAAAPGTTTGDDSVFAVAADAHGNIFLGGVSGSTEGIEYFLHSGSADVTKLDKSGTQAWKKSFPATGSTSYSVVRGVTVDKMGDVIVVGEYRGVISSNGVTLTSTANTSDVFVIKLDTAGAPKWSKTFGGAGEQLGIGISADADGNVFITGVMAGTMDFGTGTLNANGVDAFVAKLDGATGTPTWGKIFGDGKTQIGWDVVATPDGNVAVTGQFEGSIDFGQGDLGYGDDIDIYLAKLDGDDGNQKWAKRFGESEDQVAHGIAADAGGNIVITGSMQGKIDFGDGPLDIGPGTPTDAFVARFAPDGSHLWSKLFGDSANNQVGRDVAVDAAGNVLVTGFFTGTLQIGNTVLVNSMGNGGASDVFVVKLKASDGSLGWARGFGDTNTQLPRAITVDPLGNVIFGGVFGSTIDFAPPAGLSFTSMNSTYDAFWAKLAP